MEPIRPSIFMKLTILEILYLIYLVLKINILILFYRIWGRYLTISRGVKSCYLGSFLMVKG